MCSQSPQQQWVLGEEEEADGYADEQTAARESSEMECTKKNSRSDRPQNQRRKQQQRVQQPESAAAREQPQQGKGTITKRAAAKNAVAKEGNSKRAAAKDEER